MASSRTVPKAVLRWIRVKSQLKLAGSHTSQTVTPSVYIYDIVWQRFWNHRLLWQRSVGIIDLQDRQGVNGRTCGVLEP